MGTRIRRFGAITLGTALALIAGIALAAWLSSATGAGASQAGRAQNGVISVNVAGDALFPGSSINNASVKVANPNPYAVSVTLPAGRSDAVSGTNCTAGTVTTDAANPVTVPANGTTAVALTARMSAGADNSCQGQTFNVPLSSTMTSTAS